MPNSDEGRPYPQLDYDFNSGPTIQEVAQQEQDAQFQASLVRHDIVNVGDFKMPPLPVVTLTPAYTDDTEKAIVEACNELARVLISKRRDYGPGNIPRHGEFGVAVRADDKLSRITNLLKTNKPNNEAIEDSWQDLAGYAIIGRLVRQGKW